MRKSLTDQMRDAVAESGLTQDEICRLTAIDKGSMSRFLHRDRGLRLDSLEMLFEVLKLEVTTTKRRRSAKAAVPEITENTIVREVPTIDHDQLLDPKFLAYLREKFPAGPVKPDAEDFDLNAQPVTQKQRGDLYRDAQARKIIRLFNEWKKNSLIDWEAMDEAFGKPRSVTAWEIVDQESRKPKSPSFDFPIAKPLRRGLLPRTKKNVMPPPRKKRSGETEEKAPTRTPAGTEQSRRGRASDD
jgi:hypothetical protein